MNRFLRVFLSGLLACFLALALAQTPPETYVHRGSVLPSTLDPAQAYDGRSMGILENLYETLYTYDSESVKDYLPLLATSYEVSEDGLSYTFTLREGVIFHSGNPFTCRDVEYSLERVLVVNPADSGGFLLAEPLLATPSNARDTLGEGASDADYARFWRRIDQSVECLDDFTVRFTLAWPDASFFAKLLFSAFGIVDSQWAVDQGMWDGSEATWRDWIGANLHEHALHRQVSGTGAYRLLRWDDDSLLAERFKDYWGEAPALARVLYEQVADPAGLVLALRQADADSIFYRDPIILPQLTNLPGVTVHERADWLEARVTFLAFNVAITLEDNPHAGSGRLDGRGIPADFFADPDMRKCVAYSFDQETYLEEVLQGKGQVLTMALPPSFLGYNSELPVYDLNAAQAEAHCRRAHGGEVWGRGFVFTAVYPLERPTGQAALEIIKANLEALHPGFHMEVRGLARPDYQATMTAGRGTLFFVGSQAAYADPDSFMYNTYLQDDTDGNQLADAGVSELVLQARTTTSAAERDRLYREVGARAYEAVPLLPLPIAQPFIVTRNNLRGAYYNPMLSGRFLWRYLFKD